MFHLLSNKNKFVKIVNHTAKECINEFIESKEITVKELILNAQQENVKKAFENVIKYLETVGV